MGIVRRRAWAGLLIFVLSFSMFSVSPSAEAVDVNYYPAGDTRPSIAAMGMDFFIVRPLTFTLTVVGSVFWFVSLPVTALGGNVEEAGEKMVLDPGRYTFVRPLGHMHVYADAENGDKTHPTAMGYR